MAPKLYTTDASPAVRAVYLLQHAIGLELEKVPVNLVGLEQMKPEYLQMNPQHTVPTLDDNGFIVWDSHAIITYLVGAYGKDDSLYPKDLKKRAVIDQRLHFNSSILFPRLAGIVGPILREGVKTVPKDKADLVIGGYTFLESFLEGKTYVAGADLSIADFAIVASVSSLNIFVPIADNRYPNIAAWMTRMQALPYYKEANQVGLDQLTAFIKSKMA